MPPTRADIEKADENTDGTAEKVNVDPPSPVKMTMEAADEDETVKSDARPVVAPNAPETLITQEMGAPERIGVKGVHLNVEAVVGIP